ncbi:DNA cytosine methyltransferase [Exiguobacterium flavidum]|uniref:DNA cytosine methyltransferase n=1 Tax=Exiguobacterium flavidum TaxID=2184695 RepID=UPI001E2D9AE4|nr:DNA cytosine methyltransferase [Exiguobacterium flavidum]
MQKKYQLLDLFSGAGGLSNGFEQTGRFAIVGAVEINTAAQKTYIRNHLNEEVILKDMESGTSDITKINFTDLNLDSEKTIIVGGPPCQGFSNANRQKNYLISGNNQLVKEYVRAIRDIKPAAFLMENVKSINSSVHKFFVTKYVEKDLNDFSSKIHLDSIVNKNETLYELDTLNLMSSTSESLKNILKNFLCLSDVPRPIITNPVLITRLRTIERKIMKKDEIKLKKKEKNEIKQIIDMVSSSIEMKKYARKIQECSVTNFLLIIQDQQIDEHAYNEIKDFIDLNRFLTRCQELKDENIDCNTLHLKEGIEFEVNINVYSYNVVMYLKKLFAYYGYSIDSKVLDASCFGVPQRRKRFMMLGIRNNDINVCLPDSNDSKVFSVRDAIGDLEFIAPQKKIESYDANTYKPYEKKGELLEYYRENMKETEIFDHINTNTSKLIQERYNKMLETDGKNFHSLPEYLKETYSDASRTQNTVYLRLNYNEPSPTVINVRKSMWQHPQEARAISIREAARLQSFQDKFIFEGKKDERYQQVGNAVPPLMAKAVAERMLEYLDRQHSTN